jgi:hypothetical protein
VGRDRLGDATTANRKSEILGKPNMAVHLRAAEQLANGIMGMLGSREGWAAGHRPCRRAGRAAVLRTLRGGCKGDGDHGVALGPTEGWESGRTDKPESAKVHTIERVTNLPKKCQKGRKGCKRPGSQATAQTAQCPWAMGGQATARPSEESEWLTWES